MSLMAIMTGVLIAIALYLLMSKQFSRWLYGLILVSSTINIIILLAGRIFFSQPAFINAQPADKVGNPLPQAMVLTAIVISFALIAFSLIILRTLHKRGYPMYDNPPEDTPLRTKKRYYE
ncbi:MULTISPECIES: NADH-quinone oxidoreductase subunit K [unclassified Legionella]|uniref:NADH-quinone oxidoreductase subunit K n=1 Tax=unclassified Legionella TaxID=2622702 RepID=UPI0010556352|nr:MULTISPECIES: NADH-quinone oxidoreductase subunit K [unclassified Legionella]MDI9819423.1 NADH-quinone oxidoreductase subunit K [Legionella sp. PL877]